MNFLAEILALGVGLIWALASLTTINPVRVFGGLALSRVRHNVTSLLLLAVLLVFGAFEVLTWRQALLLCASGFVGIFLGDSFLLTALERLGPRRNAMIFATNAPMTALLAVALGKDQINALEWLGILFVFLGVLLAIVYGKRGNQVHQWEQVRGPLWVGVGLSLLAALGQAVGLVLTDFVVDVGVDDKPPVVLVAFIRVGITAVAFNALLLAGVRSVRTRATVSRQNWALAITSSILGVGLGMPLLVWAQSLGSQVGLISALSQTTPIWVLLLLWLWTGERPAGLAFAGAATVVAGVFLIQVI